jgi:hypothetical protein
MSEARVLSARRSLTTPRAAAVAGIVFAVLYGASQVLIRISTPTDEVLSAAWLQAHSGTIALALNLVPYAGIAFLWFIGVIRDRLGDVEDRFVATVFLGSGLLFLALTFVGAAISGGLLASYAAAPGALDESVLTFGREVIYQVINIYAVRMAGVFMISLGAIWLRTGVMHRGWAVLNFALALVLLVSISHSPWVTLIFPGWVLAVSVYFLIRSKRDQSLERKGEAGAA